MAMRNKKQLLADFYLELLSVDPATSLFRMMNQKLYASVREALARELCEDEETVQRIFERMAMEDRK